MHTLIIGNKGQLGTALSQALPAGEFSGVDLDVCDATNPDDVRKVFERSEPRLVFNTCAYNLVDQAETDYEDALAVNALAPGRIAAQCRQRDAVFVHYSTDYVFGHGYTDPIDESATPAPLSRYGRSKLLGERLDLRPGRHDGGLRDGRHALVERCVKGERGHAAGKRIPGAARRVARQRTGQEQVVVAQAPGS